VLCKDSPIRAVNIGFLRGALGIVGNIHHSGRLQIG
jgi:hypothetical protein